MIELAQASESKSPETVFSELGQACGELGITKQDMYGDFAMTTESSWLRRFESELSTDLGKSDCIFLPSGTMGQQISLMIHKERTKRNSFVCHFSSHLLLHEQQSYSKLCQLECNIIPPDENQAIQLPVSYEVAMQYLTSSPPPACLVLECPHREIGGKCTSFDDLVKISTYCRVNGIALHMDGARLWEATAAYGKSAAELCALFDSVYVSFYKGLGGMTGAALLGDFAFIASSRVWLRRFGGNLFTLMPYAVSSWSGYRKNAGAFQERRDRLRQAVAAVTDALGAYTTETGAPLVRFDPPVPEVSLIHVYFNADTALVDSARQAAADECGVRCFSKLRMGEYGAAEQSYTEFNLVRKYMWLTCTCFVDAVCYLCRRVL
jgi:threonine aldolase